MSHYSHLTLDERYQISALMQNNISIAEIARTLHRDGSTIYREIKRNRGLRGYRPKQANTFAKGRKAHNQARLTDFFWHYVEHLLQNHYSPEQINGRLKMLGWRGVGSIEAIYLYIYQNKKAGGTLYTFLRNQKTYRKRSLNGNDRRGRIVDRVDISERPRIVDKRVRIGDWEGDTIIGKNHRGVLLTYVDRVSRFTKIKALPNRKAELIAEASVELLQDHPVLTITFDNGKEFSDHEIISKELEASIYFARPYHSWERGTNENTNGLIRQFFKKDQALDNLHPEDVQRVEDLLNNRPRKVLGYLTPYEFLAKNASVALRV